MGWGHPHHPSQRPEYYHFLKPLTSRTRLPRTMRYSRTIPAVVEEVAIPPLFRAPALLAFCVEAHESFRGSFHGSYESGGSFRGSFHERYGSFHAKKNPASFLGSFRESFHGICFHKIFHGSFHGSSGSFHGRNFLNSSQEASTEASMKATFTKASMEVTSTKPSTEASTKG